MIAKSFTHIERNMPPMAHTSMYVWHKFWSRKTWNVVAEHIKAYCPENGVVFDPFSGSGVTALESLKQGKRVICCDLLPISTEILRLTIKPVDLQELEDAFHRIEKKVKDKILELYVTNCRSCKREIPIACAIWSSDKCKEIRYVCPYCKDRQEKGCRLTKGDKDLIEEINKTKIKYWYPQNPLYYPDGSPFKEKQQYESLDELFTKKNLLAASILYDAIQQEKKQDLHDFLVISFVSIIHLCTRMMPVRPTRPFSSVWNEHSYWYAETFMEQNVWDKFESSILGPQGIIEAKKESNKYYSKIKFGKTISEVLNKKADIFILRGDSLDFMEKIERQHSQCIDYIFTDPPYDAAVQFGELAFLWVAWLTHSKGYLEEIVSKEIVRNERQGKDFDVYHAMLRRAFTEMFNIIKPDSYCTVTFHSPTFKVRNATIRAATFAGFEFQKIHHQELARPSAKSLLQPFGSATGDFYLRFHKPSFDLGKKEPQEIDTRRFESIVVDTTIHLIAERAEPTPYTLIINYVDPVLAKNGYFSSLDTGLDIKTVLEDHLKKEFCLVPAEIGGAKGELWWLTEEVLKKTRIEDVPLLERVEEVIYRLLNSDVRITFTDAWEKVSIQFPNSLTTDSTSIKEALQIYAREVSGGYWMLKPEIKQAQREHGLLISMLSELGDQLGYKVWVGKKEQSETVSTITGKTLKLSNYVNIELSVIKNATNLDTVGQIDVLWIKNRTITHVFEIEATTSMTSALVRGSNITGDIERYMILPEAREEQLKRKLKSPMFFQEYQQGNWKVIYFETFKQEYKNLKSNDTQLINIVDQIKLGKKEKSGAVQTNFDGFI